VTRLVQRPQKQVYLKSSKAVAEKGVLMELLKYCNVNANYYLERLPDSMGSAFEGCPNALSKSYDKQIKMKFHLLEAYEYNEEMDSSEPTFKRSYNGKCLTLHEANCDPNGFCF